MISRWGVAYATLSGLTLLLGACGQSPPIQARVQAPLSALLAFNSQQTARIVGASNARPARLDLLLTALGRPNPTTLWQSNLRTIVPFTCQTPSRTTVRCAATLSVPGTAKPAGFVNVMMFDHDVAPSSIAADMDRLVAVPPGSSALADQQPLATAGENRAVTCRQGLDSSGSTPTICIAQIDPRMFVLTSIAAGSGVTGQATGELSSDVDMARAALASTVMAIDAVRQTRVDANGSFKISGRSGADRPLAGPGWYFTVDDVFEYSYYAGPYRNSEACQADMANTKTASMAITPGVDLSVATCELK